MSDALTIRLDEATLGALDQLAAKTDRSRNWLAAKAIQDYIALTNWQVGRIETGIAAAERGDFASDAEIQRVRAKFASTD